MVEYCTLRRVLCPKEGRPPSGPSPAWRPPLGGASGLRPKLGRLARLWAVSSVFDELVELLPG
jgi:hypothetical protein